MFDLIEKAFLAGLGVVSLSRKKTEEFLSEIQEKYHLSEEERRQFIDRAQKMMKEGKERISGMVDAEVKQAMEKIGVVPREEFERLLKRVEELEKRSGKG